MFSENAGHESDFTCGSRQQRTSVCIGHGDIYRLLREGSADLSIIIDVIIMFCKNHIVANDNQVL